MHYIIIYGAHRVMLLPAEIHDYPQASPKTEVSALCAASCRLLILP